MKLAFWNMQRLGENDTKRTEAIATLVKHYAPNFIFLCELTGTHADGQANTTNPYTLRYLCLNSAGHPMNLTFASPDATEAWTQARFKGGTNFDNLAPRGLAYIAINDQDTGERLFLYMIHGPASNNAIKVASFVACYLDDLHGDNPWIVLGDHNVEPSKLAQAPVGIDMGGLIVAPDEPTHKRGKVLDYAMTNIEDVAIVVMRRSQRISGSDHNPIIVEF